MNNIDKIYVLHHKPMIDRGNILKKRLDEEGIECEWVEIFSPEEIGDNYEKYLENWQQFEDIEIIHPYGKYQNFGMKISIGSLSLVLKHLWCFNDQIKNNYENVLILEDDVKIPQNFKSYLNNNIKDFVELFHNENIEMLMMGTSHNFITKNYISGKYAHYSENQKTRCTHAYITNINATKRIVEKFKPINLPIDFKLNEIIQLEKIKVAWSEPGLTQL